MKIKFDGDYREINISVKGLYNSERANKDDIGSFLNELAIVYFEAAERNEMLGANAIAREYREKSNQLQEICDKLGIYEK